jgi:hypothetical protein
MQAGNAEMALAIIAIKNQTACHHNNSAGSSSRVPEEPQKNQPQINAKYENHFRFVFHSRNSRP